MISNLELTHYGALLSEGESPEELRYTDRNEPLEVDRNPQYGEIPDLSDPLIGSNSLMRMISNLELTHIQRTLP
jgi:hypothetical protein